MPSLFLFEKLTICHIFLNKKKFLNKKMSYFGKKTAFLVKELTKSKEFFKTNSCAIR